MNISYFRAIFDILNRYFQYFVGDERVVTRAVFPWSKIRVHAHHSPAIIYYSVLDQRSRDPYRLLAYVHTSGSFAKKKKKIKRERDKRSEKARPSETSGTRNEKEEQGQRTGENAKKEERQRGRVGVLLPADLSY